MKSTCAIFLFAALASCMSLVAADGCNDDSDIAIFQAQNATFHATIQKCAVGCLGAEACSITCFESTLNLSTSCATCFGDDVACTSKHCTLACVNPSSASCLTCHTKYCLAALETCAGTPLPGAAPALMSLLVEAEDDGGCNDATDIAIFQAQNATFHATIQGCAEGCLGAEACSIACFQKDLNLTTPCATCFGDDVACSSKHCTLACINPTSTGCLACHTKYCLATLEACAGTPLPGASSILSL